MAVAHGLPRDRAVAGRRGPARKLRLGHFPNITHAQALYARAGGQFEAKIGVPIEWTSFNAGPTAIEAMFADAIDATFVGPNPALNGYIKSEGQKFVIIAGAASGGAGLVVRSDAGITTEKDFANKTIAPRSWPTPGRRGALVVHVARLQAQGKRRQLGLAAAREPRPADDVQTQGDRRCVDDRAWVSRLEIEAGGRLFLDEKTLWPEGRYVTTQLIINKEFLAGNPKLVAKLLESLVEVTQQINADKPAAAKIINAELQKETGKPLPAAVIERAMQRVELTWDPIATSLRQSADAATGSVSSGSPAELQGIYALKTLNAVLAAKQLSPVSE
jgi:NitT/TauT family transport system substrate-binding protein